MADEKVYEGQLASQGLDSDNLTFGSILRQPVLMGFFSGILLGQFNVLFGDGHHMQRAITAFALTVIFLAVSRFYLDTLGIISWRLSERWARVWMQILNFFIFTSFLLTTTFLVHWLQDTAHTNLLQVHEALTFVLVSVVALFYFSDLQSQILRS